MIRDFTWMEKYEEVMSDEHPLVLFYSNYAWVIIAIRNITLTRRVVKNIYTKIRNSINETVTEGFS